MSTATSESAEGLRHVGRVLRRWWGLLLAGTLIALLLAGTALIGSTTRYAGEAVILVNQPGLARLQDGKTVVEKVASLLPTYAQLAVSDEVLESVREEVGITGSIDALRRDIRVAPVPETLTLRLRVERDTERAAVEAAEALVDALTERIADMDDQAADLLVEQAEDPATVGTLAVASRTTVTQLQAATVTELSQDVVQTLVLAIVLGLGFSAVAAFVLDRS